MYKEVKRGDIFYADLSPVKGSEQGGYRPVLVIQNDVGNKFSTTVIVASITGRVKKQMPTHYRIKNITKLNRDSIVLLEQIRTIDKERLEEYVSTLPINYMVRIDNALKISLELE